MPSSDGGVASLCKICPLLSLRSSQAAFTVLGWVASYFYRGAMDWSILVSTAVGALLGVGSTLAGDRMRWRREEHRNWIQTRRETYIEHLRALSSAHANLRAVAHNADTSSTDRYVLLNTALDDSGIWRSRQALSLVAPHDVIQLAITAAKAVESVRDALMSGADTANPVYIMARDELWTANAELRSAMREDLGVPGVPDPEVLAIRLRHQDRGPDIATVQQ